MALQDRPAYIIKMRADWMTYGGASVYGTTNLTALDTGSTFYVSTDGGQTFTAAATSLGTTGQFNAMPGVEGEIWLASDTGLYHSANSGSTFTQLTASSSAVSIGSAGRPLAAPTGRSTPWPRSTVFGACTGPTTPGSAGCGSTTTSTSTATLARPSRVTRRSMVGCISAPTAAASSWPIPPVRRAPPRRRGRRRAPDVASAAADGHGWLLCHVCEDRPVGHRQRRLPGRGADHQHRNDRHHELDGDMTFANGQTLSQIWGSRTTIPGSSPYTVLNEGWNGALSPRQTATFGFLGIWKGANDPPAVSCARTP
ncbi:cellulose-binding domain-containing protein [Micromonospora sp. CPCC 205371]|nr:cellulose-binding domain-containing protein [Micromonospora sp. CPCC 205371]